MSKQAIIRTIILVSMSIASFLGTWFAYEQGRSALGLTGGLLVALVAALLLGGLVYIAASLLPRTSENDPERQG